MSKSLKGKSTTNKVADSSAAKTSSRPKAPAATKSVSQEREDRNRRYGVDCPDELLWRHWNVGGEYVRTLVIKNTHDKLQVIQYKLPRQKATFFVEFPEPVTLSSGMAYELVVRFRPTELIEHHDSLEIEVKGRGSFTIGLAALTPYAKLITPQKFDFQFCPVNALSKSSLSISNGGTVPLNVAWECPEPFKIEPQTAALAEGEQQNITVSFTPTEANAMVGQAVCRSLSNNEVLSVMKISGIGKYCFVRCTEEPTIDFGKVLTSTTVTKTVVVQNTSCVDAEFEISRTDKDIVNPFQWFPTKGTIPRDSEIKLSLKYSPQSTGAHYTNDFVMKTTGGNKIDFRCVGLAQGPTLDLKVRTIDFEDVDLDKDEPPRERHIVLRNTSAMDVEFHWVGNDPGSAFIVSPFEGTLAAKKMMNVSVKFNPKTPMNYSRRLYCLAKHSDQALFVDVLGSAFNAKQRPAPFNHKHVVAYNARVEAGLGLVTPDDLEKLWVAIDEGSAPIDEDENAARQALQMAAVAAEKQKAVPLSQVLPAEERMQLPFTLEDTRVVFHKGVQVDNKIVNVRNHTSAKATAVWCVPENCPWTVVPNQADVPAFGVSSFKIRFSSQAPTTSFGQFLDCFVFYKSMRSFRLVSERTFAPSQCLSLQAQCITPLTETSATPQISVPLHVAFPACQKGNSVFQVIPLRNEGDTVAAFDIKIDASMTKEPRHKTLTSFEDPSEDEMNADALEASRAFTCFPQHGTIPPSGTALVLLKFEPRTTNRYRGMAAVAFNESSIGGRKIVLRGEGHMPTIQMANDSILSFRPTSVGGTTSRKYVIENPSRIPVRFEAQVSDKQSVTLIPSSGTLAGCERLEVEAQFSPTSAKRYELTVPIQVSSAVPGAQEERHFQALHVVGEGVVGVIAVEPLEVHFGTVLVGADSHRTITVYNSSLCDVHYTMNYVVKKSDTTHGDGEAPPLIFMPKPTGILRARSHVCIEVTVRLPYRGDFGYTVYVISGGTGKIVDSTKPSVADVERLPHCDVTVCGGHPTLEITDARSVYQRKSHLWRQLSVPQINNHLALAVEGDDTEKDSFTFESASAHLKPIHCDLGVDVFRTAPIRVLLRLDNTGHCPVNFKFWFPHESEVPKEPWHQEPTLSESDLELAEVIDRRLFDVSPRSATVPVGGHVVVVFTYQHTKIGQHSLPILLRIDQGRRMLIHLTARTLHETTKFLSFHHTLSHELLPVAVGDMAPPLQYTELQNLGHQPAQYSVDPEALLELREKNFDFPIFQCLNPRGVIPPMSTLLLSWYFRPLEVKRYTVAVKILVEGGETYTLNLSGNGYNPKKCTPEEIRKMHDTNHFPLPVFPTLRHPLLPLRLSMDVLRFNTISFHSLHRQVVTLHNSHPKDTFLFEWHCALQFGDQLLDVDPPRGRIKAGESVQFRIAMYSGSTSHIIDNPIHCHVLNEDLRNRRLGKRDALEAEAAMQLEQPSAPTEAVSQNSQSLTGGSLTQAAREVKKDRRVGKHRAPITTIPAKYQSTGRLRQAIQQLTEAAVAEELDDDDPELTYVEVLPTVLEVLVQARIVPLEQFQEVYGRPALQQHFYPSLMVHSTAHADPASVCPVTQSESKVVRDVLDSLLTGVVHDPRIAEAYQDVSEDPVPYFCQMSTEAASKTFTDEVAPPAVNEDGGGGEQQQGDVEGAAAKDLSAVPGNDQCLVEEVLEELIYKLIGESTTDGGILNPAAGSSTPGGRRLSTNPKAKRVTMSRDSPATVTPTSS